MNRLFLLIALVLPLVLGCGDKSKDDAAPKPSASVPAVTTDQDKAKELIGVWKGEDGTIEFKADGTCIQSSATGGSKTMTYKVSEGRLVRAANGESEMKTDFEVLGTTLHLGSSGYEKQSP